MNIFSFGEKPGKDMLGQPVLCLLHSLCIILFPMHCHLWGLPWQTDQNLFDPLSLHCCTYPVRDFRKKENTVFWQSLEKSPVLSLLRSKRHDDDYQTPILTLVQLDSVIWELMLAFIVSLTAKNLLAPAPSIFGLLLGWIRMAHFHFPQQRVFLTDSTHVPVADRKSSSKAMCLILNPRHWWHWDH